MCVFLAQTDSAAQLLELHHSYAQRSSHWSKSIKCLTDTSSSICTALMLTEWTGDIISSNPQVRHLQTSLRKLWQTVRWRRVETRTYRHGLAADYQLARRLHDSTRLTHAKRRLTTDRYGNVCPSETLHRAQPAAVAVVLQHRARMRRWNYWLTAPSLAAQGRCSCCRRFTQAAYAE